MDEMITEFRNESCLVVSQISEILERLEDGEVYPSELEKVGLLIDRIMGGSQSLALAYDPELPEVPILKRIGQYAEVCKAVGYKGSQIKDQSFLTIVVALLIDVIELIEMELDNLEEPMSHVASSKERTMLERLEWVANKFDKNLRGTVAVDETGQTKNLQQNKIDELIRKFNSSS